MMIVKGAENNYPLESPFSMSFRILIQMIFLTKIFLCVRSTM